MPERTVGLDVFDLPMSVRFRGVTRRQGVLVHGGAGVGEFSPFWEYDDEESAPWLAAALEAADDGFPRPVRTSVAVNCTVPAVDPELAARLVRESHGCRSAKVKVAEPGQTLDDDVARVASVRAAIGPEGAVRVDANGGWDVDTAVTAIKVLDEFGLEYVEQPTATVEELAAVRRRVDVRIAADESIRRARDPLRVAALDAADIVVLKVQPLGGVRACLRLADQVGLPVVVSSALESSVGLAAGVALAAALPDLPYACGLATTAMLARDLTAHPLTVINGEVPVSGVLPDAELVEQARPDDETVSRWLDRLARCRLLLGRGR
jgi:o-succinylbenzoate synthase